jgi:5-methylcytosine-specific restriction protein A
MAKKPRSPCGHFSCGKLVESGERYCDEHKLLYEAERNKYRKRYDKSRGSSAKRGYDYRWRKYRLWHLKHHPLCVHCLAEGRYVPATVVDHIIPHKGDEILFWDPKNHQSLCAKCHNRKTASEDGGFGNKVKR